MDIIVASRNVSSHAGRFHDELHSKDAALDTPELRDAIVEQALDQNSVFRRAEFGRYVVSAEKQETTQVILAMKGMIRAAEDGHNRATLSTVNVSASGRAPSTNPLEQWMTGATSPAARPTKTFEETPSPLLFASHSPVLRHGASNRALCKCTKPCEM